MNTPEPNDTAAAIDARRRKLARSLLAANAAIVITRSELRTATDRENDARRLRMKTATRLADSDKAQRALAEQYRQACQDLTTIAHGAVPRMPAATQPLALSPSTPSNAYSDPNYPTHYEGYSTMETFSIAHIIDNTKALRGDLELRWGLMTIAPSAFPILDRAGYATSQALDLYGPLIMAALEELRWMKEPIDLARVDLDDLIRSWEPDRLEHLARGPWRTMEPYNP